MNVKIPHFLWAAAPIMAHHFATFHPALGGDEPLDIFTHFCSESVVRPSAAAQSSEKTLRHGLPTFRIKNRFTGLKC